MKHRMLVSRWTTIAALMGVGSLSACGADGNNMEPPPVIDSGVGDFPTMDAGMLDAFDAGMVEPPPDPDAGLDPDSGPDSATDSAPDSATETPIGSEDPPGCDPAGSPVEPGTLAFYRFDSDTDANLVEDAMGAYPGSVHGAIARNPGRNDCGLALDFATALPEAEASNYVEIPHAPAWDLPAGSLDFWLRMDSLPERGAGLISRDASQIRRAGHLTVLLNAEGRVIVRLQRMGTDNNDRVFLCGEAPLELSTWTHVEFRFGPPHAQLYIDGALSTYDGETPSGLGGTDATATCGGLWIDGIAGNENPWVIGAAAVSSEEGSATPLSLPFRHGAIDDVRIRAPSDAGQQPESPF